ncbi:MAG: DUF3343 domain-containing protein [Chloroflexi bacterium]|nr:DUF3343 domain-containing protein [Chloroflexota bacterium]
MIRDRYAVILVYSTSYAIRAEKILHQAGIESKLIPVPRHLSSNCGVCLRIERTDAEPARQSLEDANVEIDGIRHLE